MCHAQGHSAVMPVRLEPATPRSRVKHSTTEPRTYGSRGNELKINYQDGHHGSHIGCYDVPIEYKRNQPSKKALCRAPGRFRVIRMVTSQHPIWLS